MNKIIGKVFLATFHILAILDSIQSFSKNSCAKPLWATDVYCDDENNNVRCNFDGGACCGQNVNKKFCTECECHQENIAIFGRSFPSKSKQGNTDCDDTTKYASKCPHWAKHGECTKSAGFMKKHCKKSCNLCTENQCEDSIKFASKCPHWEKHGECVKSAKFMKKHCKKSCNLCPGCTKDDQCVEPNKNICKNNECQCSNGFKAEGHICVATGTDCEDEIKHCKKWEQQGECNKIESQKFMKKYCKKTCDMCSVTQCTDVLPEHCPIWKAMGECTQSPEFMKKNCNKTCHMCSACPATGQIVDNDACVCPADQVLNDANDACEPCPVTGQIVDNDACVCPADQVLNTAGDTCECPASGQTIVEGACVCPSDRVLNDAGDTCEECPAPAQTIVDGVCVCPSDRVLNDAGDTCETCPATGQIVDNDVCVCPADQVLNDANDACEPCPSTAQTIVEGVCTCPATGQIVKPFSFPPACACPHDQVLNDAADTCEDCPDASFTIVNGECVCPEGTTLDLDTCAADTA